MDAMGRPIRRNELSFPENDACRRTRVFPAPTRTSYFDADSGQWRIFDDGSSLGTTLFRDGRRIDVPAHASRGVALRPGDEIYLGQVAVDDSEAVIS